MKFQVKKVHGVQSDMVKRLGLVKIAKSSAEDLFNMGIPLVVAPNKVNDFHFFGGWHLAFHLDSQRYFREDVSFQEFVNSWNAYNSNNEMGTIAFFVDKQFVA